jgi:uncharacterized membrane protein
MQELLKHARRSFLAGLLVITPLTGSIAILVWLFNTFTDFLLVLPEFLSQKTLGIHHRLVALVLFVLLVTLLGWVTRLVAGKRMITIAEKFIERVPLLSKIYLFIKQVSDTMLGRQKTVFERVVMVEYPRYGVYTLGFVTNEEGGEAQVRTNGDVINVFFPTTPNPTSGWLALVPREQVIDMEMSVSDGMKMIISGGSVVPQWPAPSPVPGPDPQPTDKGAI